MKKEDVLPTWDVTKVYADAAAWDADFARIGALAGEYAGYRGRLAESAAVLSAAFEAGERLERLLAKLQTYASLTFDEDTRRSDARERLGRFEAASAALSPQLAWFEPELLAIPAGQMDALAASPELAFRRRQLDEILRSRPHTLSEPEERLLGQFGGVLDASAETFGTLNDTDLTFGKLRDGGGTMRELTHGSYGLFLQDASRSVRKAAFTRMYRRYQAFRNTFAATLDATIRCHVLTARARHFDSALSMALFPDRIPPQVYEGLIETAHGGLDALKGYLALRRNRLGLKKLDMYDLYTPLVPGCCRSFTWDEAASTVLEALAPMGDAYRAVVERAFRERWVDVPERPGKRSGGYSGGCYDTAPYILLNFNGTLDDVFTLIHELGHSVHSYYSRTSQEPAYADYRIFVAEVASTTNELLLAEYLLSRTDDPGMKAYLIGHLIDEIRTTFFRQTMFAEFELKLHRLAEADTPLTADLLETEYYRLNETYYGLKADRLIGMEWARIPHFYYNFYVYQYATGISAAIRLSSLILRGTDAERSRAREAYLGFLRGGCSKDVLDLLRDAGVDLSSPEPVAAAVSYFETLVRRLEAL